MASNSLFTGKVVVGSHYDLAEVEFFHHGRKRRIPISRPSGYHPQHALKDKHVKFTLIQDPNFTSDIGFADIQEILPCAPLIL